MKKRKYNFVYITINLVNRKFYIGKHSIDNLDDGYLGSGKALLAAIRKYGKNNFKRRILCFCDSEDDAYEVEKFLVTDYIVNREDCYNLHIGGKGGKMNEETNKRHSLFMKEYYKKNTTWNAGKKMSDEFREKCRKRMLGKPSYERTDEHKEQMRNIQKGKKHNFSDESKQKLMEGVKKAGQTLRERLLGTHLTPEQKEKAVPLCLFKDQDGKEHKITKQNAARWHKDWIFIKIIKRDE